jgi:hypothetical protein
MVIWYPRRRPRAGGHPQRRFNIEANTWGWNDAAIVPSRAEDPISVAQQSGMNPMNKKKPGCGAGRSCSSENRLFLLARVSTVPFSRPCVIVAPVSRSESRRITILAPFFAAGCRDRIHLSIAHLSRSCRRGRFAPNRFLGVSRRKDPHHSQGDSRQ